MSGNMPGNKNTATRNALLGSALGGGVGAALGYMGEPPEQWEDDLRIDNRDCPYPSEDDFRLLREADLQCSR